MPSSQIDAPRAAAWRPVAETPDHPLARIDGAEVGNGVRMPVEIGPTSRTNATAFRVFLDADGLGRTDEPVIFGLHHDGRVPAHRWVEVTAFQGRVPLGDGQVEVPEGIDAQIIATIGTLVPAGGHLMVEYDSAHRQSTARALAAHVPPAATPVGAMMFSAGCGVAFRDWYTNEGGRAGPRKLQGFRAVDAEHARLRAVDGLEALEAFMARSKDLDWDLQIACRPLAEQVMGVLRERLGIGDGPVPLDLGEYRR